MRERAARSLIVDRGEIALLDARESDVVLGSLRLTRDSQISAKVAVAVRRRMRGRARRATRTRTASDLGGMVSPVARILALEILGLVGRRGWLAAASLRCVLWD
jgi:hypothetical protein